MISYIGNYASIIQESWFEDFKKAGEIRPNLKMSENPDKSKYVLEQAQEWIDAGYDLWNGSVKWEMFWEKHITEAPDLQSLEFCNGKYTKWWFAKVMPGKCFPKHKDAYDMNFKKVSRYWMAIDDHQWGHIFMLENTILSDYKKGDVFKFDDDVHAGANVGMTPKISLQIVVAENE